VNPAGGRSFSSVTGRPLSTGSPQAAKCTFKIPFLSFKNATHRPSGETCGLANAGFPKKISRSMRWLLVTGPFPHPANRPAIKIHFHDIPAL
jgi:hypothetical protein